MASAAAALLDELMGRDRNLQPSEQRTETRWDDKDVCKYFLCGFCPHELFVNTRADLGPCDKIHDEALRKEYEGSSRYQKMSYEDDFFRFLSNLISDVEKRIRRGHQRLALNNQQGTLNGNAILTGKEERIQILTQKINELVEKAEQLGCEGNVEEAQGVMKLCDQLKEERTQLEETDTGDGPQVKQMEVCEVCGAFLIVGDMKQRIDEHLLGKQHMGYARARATVEKMKEKMKKEVEEREAREARILREREDREKEREKEREERNKRMRDERKESERSKGHRSRSRERSSHRRRSHSRDRHRRSRSRDRHRSSRRSRSKEREKKAGGSRRSPHKDRHRERNEDKRRERVDK